MDKIKNILKIDIYNVGPLWRITIIRIDSIETISFVQKQNDERLVYLVEFIKVFNLFDKVSMVRS